MGKFCWVLSMTDDKGEGLRRSKGNDELRTRQVVDSLNS